MTLIDKADRIQLLEFELERRIVGVAPALKEPGSRLHLIRGLGARHDVLRHCFERLRQTCFTSMNEPLSIDGQMEAGLYLNGYYLNLRGAMDNLAWILQMELEVLVGATETSGKRNQVGLFHTKFLDALKAKSPSHARHIVACKQWGLNLADLRDPAAHRIPLTIPAGVLSSQEQKDEYQRLVAKAEVPHEELRGKSRGELMHAAQRVASLEPLFCLTGADGIQSTYSIPRVLVADHRRYLRLARKTLQEFE